MRRRKDDSLYPMKYDWSQRWQVLKSKSPPGPSHFITTVFDMEKILLELLELDMLTGEAEQDAKEIKHKRKAKEVKHKDTLR